MQIWRTRLTAWIVQVPRGVAPLRLSVIFLDRYPQVQMSENQLFSDDRGQDYPGRDICIGRHPRNPFDVDPVNSVARGDLLKRVRHVSIGS